MLTGSPYQVIAPNETMPNIVANFTAGEPGRHLALNGHIDVFPVGSGEGWTRDPWGGELVDGKIYGRGACDMKAGTTASLFTFLYLHEMREHLRGQLTLSDVSDEETFGPWGARYLFEHHPEVIGDCCLNAEPGSPLTLRFGEKGKLWLKFSIRTAGAHGAYTHMSRSATGIAAEVISELARLVCRRHAKRYLLENHVCVLLPQVLPVRWSIPSARTSLVRTRRSCPGRGCRG
jgi:succinyl-diaminopimelate desuccinylase